ncbi:cell division protein FtsQ/DivIB [Frigoriglobus tundricola]|uniref:Uncharacterized protein n=1 Tax=Frigoriglobus tundricola TaxID=2774151 RepID=A0A6M5Z5Y3_9BACT|nr:hypothetical protein [Frigoriglobus tundricola]QJX00992.1 hypothetical protein FTUN_8630 [Frigoriglobus tundricola]
MVKRARKAPPPGPSGWRAARPVLAVALTLGVAGALLFGLSRLGDEARRNIGPRDRYIVRFADIRCDPPPGCTREAFLAEVRYNADGAATFQSIDPDLVPNLTAAFSAHPWVLSVDGVTVEPPDAVSVKLVYRTPVLAVSSDGARRAVDVKGIVLPTSAPTAGLPELLNDVTPPGKAGQPWPGDVVVRAASVSEEYKPKSIERTEQGWQLIQRNGKKLIVGR